MRHREIQGALIAATLPIVKKGGVWLVSSQSGMGFYTVCLDAEQPHCTCADHQKNGGKCKHVYAAEFRKKREEAGVPPELIPVTPKKYLRNWRAYNAAQSNEKPQFQKLLFALCSKIPQPPRKPGPGRPALRRSDTIFAMCLKVYSGFSARRFISDLRDACQNGYVTKVFEFSSVLNALRDEELTKFLKQMLAESAKPMSAVERFFAADSSGFSTSRFDRWFVSKVANKKGRHDWTKVHLMCGVRTNVVTTAEILGMHAHDAPVFPDLVKATAENFTMEEVSADKAYSSNENIRVVEEHGAVPYIMFKDNATGEGSEIWEKAFHSFHVEKEKFMERYHQRSNVEATFGMIKAKFGDSVRSRTDVGMMNETFCKLICHNICCVIKAIHELKIEPLFGVFPSNGPLTCDTDSDDGDANAQLPEPPPDAEQPGSFP